MTNSTCWMVVLLGAVLFLPLSGAMGQSPTTRPQPSAHDLVRQLSDDSYETRDAAQKALIQMGVNALEAVQAGTNSSDEETRSRCQIILKEIQKDLQAARIEAVARGVAWKLPLDEAPADSVVVTGPLALVVDQGGVLRAIDTATGKEKWKADEKIRLEPAGPVVAGQTAYAVCYDPNAPGKVFLAAMDLASGKLLWQAQGKASVSPPAVADGVVYVGSTDKAPAAAARPLSPQLARGPDMDFEALDGKSGQSLWKLPAVASPLRPVIGKGLAFVIGNDRKVHAVDLKSHKEAWASEEFKHPRQFKLKGFSPQGLLTDGDKVLILATTSLSALAAESGKVQWKLDLPNSYMGVINDKNIRMVLRMNENGRFAADELAEPLFCVDQGFVYVSCGSKVWTVDAKTGKKEWEYESQAPNVRNPPVGGAVINVGGAIQGNGMVLGAGPKDTKDTFAPVIVKGLMYFAAWDGLYAVDLGSRQETWVLKTPGPICTPPVVAEGTVYFGLAQMPPLAPGGVAVHAVPPAPAPAPASQPAQQDKLPALWALKLTVK